MPSDRYPVLRAAAVQAAPVFLNRDATLDKIEGLVKTSERKRLPISWFFQRPLFRRTPYGGLVLAPIDQHVFFQKTFRQCSPCTKPCF